MPPSSTKAKVLEQSLVSIIRYHTNRSFCHGVFPSTKRFNRFLRAHNADCGCQHLGAKVRLTPELRSKCMHEDIATLRKGRAACLPTYEYSGSAWAHV